MILKNIFKKRYINLGLIIIIILCSLFLIYNSNNLLEGLENCKNNIVYWKIPTSPIDTTTITASSNDKAISDCRYKCYDNGVACDAFLINELPDNKYTCSLYPLDENSMDGKKIMRSCNKIANQEKKYIFENKPMKWEDHQKAARKMGGHLVCFSTSDEFNMVFTEAMKRFNNTSFWIGGRRTIMGNELNKRLEVLASNPVCKEYNDGNNVVYSFCNGKPFKRWGLAPTKTRIPVIWKEVVGRNFPFNDMAGTPPMGSTLDECKEACASDLDCKGIVYGNHYNLAPGAAGNQCFKKSVMSRSSAGQGLNSYIKESGGNIIDDVYRGEINMGKNISNCSHASETSKSWGPCPIRLQDYIDYNYWSWEDSSPWEGEVTTSHWNPGEPNNSFEDAIQVYSNGKWNDLNSSQLLPAVYQIIIEPIISYGEVKSDKLHFAEEINNKNIYQEYGQ